MFSQQPFLTELFLCFSGKTVAAERSSWDYLQQWFSNDPTSGRAPTVITSEPVTDYSLEPSTFKMMYVFKWCGLKSKYY